MGHVQADDIDAHEDDLPEPFAAFGGGADRSNDLGMPVMTAHSRSRLVLAMRGWFPVPVAIGHDAGRAYQVTGTRQRTSIRGSAGSYLSSSEAGEDGAGKDLG